MTNTLRIAAATIAVMFLSTAAEARKYRHVRSYDANSNEAQVIGGRPAGCPRAYCGCGLRKYLGIDDVRLNLAWNWTKYYRGSQTVVVWRHHVALVERMTGPRTALLRDYNSGRGLSRIHERDISRARIVNGGQYASR